MSECQFRVSRKVGCRSKKPAAARRLLWGSTAARPPIGAAAGRGGATEEVIRSRMKNLYLSLSLSVPWPTARLSLTGPRLVLGTVEIVHVAQVILSGRPHCSIGCRCGPAQARDLA